MALGTQTAHHQNLGADPQFVAEKSGAAVLEVMLEHHGQAAAVAQGLHVHADVRGVGAGDVLDDAGVCDVVDVPEVVNVVLRDGERLRETSV